MNDSKRNQSPNKLGPIIDGVIAAAIYSGLAFLASYLAHYLLQPDKQTYITILLVVCLQGILGFLTFIIGRHIEKRRQNKEFEKRTHEHHKLIHKARDMVVRMYGNRPIKSRQGRVSIMPSHYNPQLEKMLQRVSNTFQRIVPPGTNVFAAIRERQRGATEDEYVTILRAGKVDSDEREKKTQPLLRSHRMVDQLWKTFFDKDKQDCVLLTGSTDKSTWEAQPNDEKEQDLSVLLGAVFSKRWNLEKEAADPFGKNNDEPIHLEWILCVAADKEGTFNDSHKNLMKCFNDTFGLLLNVYLRETLA